MTATFLPQTQQAAPPPQARALEPPRAPTPPMSTPWGRTRHTAHPHGLSAGTARLGYRDEGARSSGGPGANVLRRPTPSVMRAKSISLIFFGRSQ